MAPECGARVVVMVVEQAHTPLEVGIGLGLVLVDGDRRTLGPAHHRLGVPIRALHQPHGDRTATPARPLDQVGEIAVRILQVGLQDDAGLHTRELGLVEQLPEELQAQALDVVVLHVEIDERVLRGGYPALARAPQDRAKAFLGLGQPVVTRERRERGRQRRGFDTHVDPRQRPEVVALEMIVGRPARCRLEQDREQRIDARGVAVGLADGDRLLAEQIDRERAPGTPEPLQALDRGRSVGAHDELLRHAGDVVTGHRRGGGLAEGHVLGQPQAQVEHPGDLARLEVLVEMAQDVGIARRGREDVDEAEELRLEGRMRHRPLEHPFAPPRCLDDPRALPHAELGDAASQGGDVVVGRGRHDSRVRPQAGDGRARLVP